MSAWGPLTRCSTRPIKVCPRRTLSLPPLTPLDSCRFLHGSPPLWRPRRREFFSSNIGLKQQAHKSATTELRDDLQTDKRRSNRTPGSKTSLRRVAVEAQRSRDEAKRRKESPKDGGYKLQAVYAFCVAERFNISQVLRIIRAEGYKIDPYNTGLYPQVIHFQASYPRQTVDDGSIRESGTGDIFVFPSGTVVAWAIPRSVASRIVTTELLSAAESPHLTTMETEDLDFAEDQGKENSSIKGDTIFIGTKNASSPSEGSSTSFHTGDTESSAADTTLAKIAFSSGLARSTKLAVLETLLDDYFDSTRSIPVMLSKGSRLPFTRSFILKKTGQLLCIRAQLNLYSELTDSLPDLFWDSRHELGLEGYYDQVGRALDVGIRIKTLNEKMDHAQEIASVLRERLSERHGLVLEWMIIALIAVEVGFEIMRLIKERRKEMLRTGVEEK